YQSENLALIAGGGWNNYEGDHFGDIIWARYASQSEIGDRYYSDNSEKSDFNTYAKLTYSPLEKWSLFGDIQYRHVRYKANGEETGPVDDDFNFFNPKDRKSTRLNSSHVTTSYPCFCF